MNAAPTPAATLYGHRMAVTKEPVTRAPNPGERAEALILQGRSLVYVSFLIEEDPVYAEQTVDVSSTQLFNRCIDPFWYVGPAIGIYPTVPVVLDNDGNAVVSFFGASCASGDSVVTADLTVGTHDTFTTTFIIKPPAVTDI